MSNNVIKLIGLMLSTTLLFAVGGTTNIQKAGSHVGQHYAEFGSTGEADALTGPIVLTTQFNRNFTRGTDDTLGFNAGWGGQFIQSPGDAMLMMYQMPADATIKGINVPVYEWGTGEQQMTVSVHKMLDDASCASQLTFLKKSKNLTRGSHCGWRNGPRRSSSRKKRLAHWH